MNRFRTITGIALLCVAVACPALAQSLSLTHVERPMLGLGVAIGKEVSTLGDFSDPVVSVHQVDFPSIYLPIRVNPGLKIEPEFGLMRYTIDASSVDQTFSIMLIGAGAFFLMNVGPVDLSWGLRFAMIKESYDHDGAADYTVTRNDMVYGPALGGEYFFTRNFSLGGEVQFNYVKLGEIETDGDDAPNNGTAEDEKIKQSILRTKPLIFVRWYFGGKRG